MSTYQGIDCPKEHMKSTYVNIILIDDKKRVLMQLRDNIPNINFPGIWCLPGGAIDEGENDIDAVIRECEEETEYQLKDPKLYKAYPYTFMEGDPITAFYTEQYDGKQKIVCHEGEKMVFLTKEQIEKYEMFPTHKETIVEVIDNLNE